MLRIFLVLLVFIYPESHQQCLSGQYEPPGPEEMEIWSRAQTTFAVDLFKIISSTYKKDNVVFSPYSIYHTVLLVYFGAFRQTEISLKSTLRLPTATKRNHTWNYYQYDQHLFDTPNKGYTMNTVEKIYFSLKYRLSHCTMAMFGNKLEKISGSAVTIVNNWLKKISNGLIVKPLETLYPMTPVSATYIKENWAIGFRPDSVTKRDFEIKPNKKVKIDMMYDVHAYETGFCEELKAFMIILPFEGRDSAMILLLPETQREGDVDDMIKKMNVDTLACVINRSKYRAERVSIVMPTFTSTKRISLKDPLNKMGALDSFFSTADYSRFTGKKEVFMENLVHHAAIQVVAENSEGDPIFERSGQTTRFIANRPFVYLVFDFSKCKLLMMGIFRKPEKKSKPIEDEEIRSLLRNYSNHNVTAV